MADPKVLAEFRRAARDFGATARERKALVEAGVVESGLRNLNYGDRDSKGALQQRSSQGWHHATDPYQAALDFLRHARANRGLAGSAGTLAQSVQRSAFPGRYDEVRGEAQRLLHGVRNSAGLASAPAPAGIDHRQAAAAVLASMQKPYDPATRQGLVQAALAASRPASASSAPSGKPSSVEHGGGLTKFDGKPVASWIAKELEYARAHGWKGTITSGYRSDADQTRIYRSGVRPAAVPQSMGGKGSNHEFKAYPGGAVDVSDPQTLSHILQRKGSPLKWAGGKDPVHFSHPHGGSY